MKEIIRELEKKYGEIEQDMESNDFVENWSNNDIEKFVKGYQFAIDIAINIVKENANNDIKDRLYQEVKNRYNELNDLQVRLQDNYNNGTEFEQTEEDRINIGAILDVADGQILE